jgi:transcriptional repressor NrdR
MLADWDWNCKKEIVDVMQCPYCHADEADDVVDTRTFPDRVKRRRKCSACGEKFTTYERIEATQILIIKRGDSRSRVPFDRGKLRRGIERACWKRPISDTQIEALIAQVEQDIKSIHDTEVESRFIGERVMYYLAGLDQVAYVRFASVYRHFENADDFIQELKRMEQSPDIPCLSSEYVPKKKQSRSPKGKRSRYKEGGGESPSLPLEDE